MGTSFHLSWLYMREVLRRENRRMASHIQFRAVIEGTGEDKAVQFFGATKAECIEAAKEVLAKNAKRWGAANVAVYHIEETLVETATVEECLEWFRTRKV